MWRVRQWFFLDLKALTLSTGLQINFGWNFPKKRICPSFWKKAKRAARNGRFGEKETEKIFGRMGQRIAQRFYTLNTWSGGRRKIGRADERVWFTFNWK